jgi:hypothetical protein
MKAIETAFQMVGTREAIYRNHRFDPRIANPLEIVIEDHICKYKACACDSHDKRVDFEEYGAVTADPSERLPWPVVRDFGIQMWCWDEDCWKTLMARHSRKYGNADHVFLSGDVADALEIVVDQLDPYNQLNAKRRLVRAVDEWTDEHGSVEEPVTDYVLERVAQDWWLENAHTQELHYLWPDYPGFDPEHARILKASSEHGKMADRKWRDLLG